MDKLLDRFLHYVSFDTQSKPNVKHTPSTDGQLKLAQALRNELMALGFSQVTLSDKGCVMATVPGNVAWKVPVIGFISHLDTAPDFTAKHVNPQVVENYRGGDIALGNGDEVLSPVMFPVLHQLLGQTLITTDGKTLLGSDDKSGIAEIITAMVRLQNSNVPHGPIRIAFTPDEEIGKGAQSFDIPAFGAEWAYTVDGGGVGELEFENFNAAGATVKIQGCNIHPGYAKDKMLNAILIGQEFNAMLPVNQRPEYTTGYEGFFHITKFEGTVEHATFQYIVRDHDRTKFEAKKIEMQRIAEFMNQRYGAGTVTVELKDQYYNMREKVEPHYHIVENAIKAMEMADVKPHVMPIRGGTDGARLSFMGLPCPNIFAGGHNFHGKFEYVPLESIVKAKEVIVNIALLYAQ